MEPVDNHSVGMSFECISDCVLDICYTLNDQTTTVHHVTHTVYISVSVKKNQHISIVLILPDLPVFYTPSDMYSHVFTEEQTAH